MAMRRHFDVENGIIIWEVAPKSAAAAAGLRGLRWIADEDNPKVELGDVLLAIGTARINGMRELRAALEQYAIGDTVSLKLLRDGKEIDVTVKLQGI